MSDHRSTPWGILCVTVLAVALAAILGTADGQRGGDVDGHVIMPGVSFSRGSASSSHSDSPARLEHRRPVMVPIRSHRVPLSASETNNGYTPYNGGNRGYQQPPEDSKIVFPGDTENVNHPVSRVDDVAFAPENPFSSASFPVVVVVDGGNEVGALELPEDMDVDKLGLDEMRALSGVGTMADFARLFGLELPEANDTTNDIGIRSRFGAAGSQQEAESAVCQPEERVVILELPVELNVFYYPRCVRLQRCGGCCAGPLLKCRPEQVEPVSLQVLRVENSDGSSSSSSTRSSGSESTGRTGGRRTPSRRRSNRRRRQATRYYTAHEENHVTCSCSCRVQKENCNADLHDYLQDDCQCRCKNSDEQSKCDVLSSTHYWDLDTCKCYCHKTHSCSTGQYFDHSSCSCKHMGVTLPASDGFFGLSPRFGGPSNPQPDDIIEAEGRNAPPAAPRIPVTFGH